MRDASNGKSIIRRIRHKAGLNLEIITGDEESQIIFDNHFNYIVNASQTADGSVADGNFLYVDVGGGSTEVSFICGGERIYSHSFNVGTIRLLKGKVRKKDFVEMKEEITKRHLRPHRRPHHRVGWKHQQALPAGLEEGAPRRRTAVGVLRRSMTCSAR